MAMLRAALLAPLVVLAQASPWTAAADWPQFRGPGGLGVSDERGLPVTWDANENIAWKTELPGAGASSPIVVGDRIFLTYHTGYATGPRAPGAMELLQRHVACFGRSGGKLLWSRRVASKLPETPYQRRMHWHGYASSTPAADAEGVYAFFGKSGVFAFDHQGRQLWHASVGSQAHGWGSGASVVLHGDLVIINACSESESLVALDRRTGRQVWRVGGIRESWNTPLLASVPGGSTELVVAMFGRVFGLDPGTGRELWACRGIRYYIVPSLVAHHGVVYCTGGRQYRSMAVRAGGRGDVTDTHVLWRANKGTNVPSPIYHGGYLYWAHDTRGIAYCADAKTGQIVYEERLSPRAGILYASPVLADGKLYYLDRGGRGFVVAAGPRFRQLACNTLDPDRGPFNASPAVSRGQLLLRSNRYLYCIGTN